jgi:hypothetical protein
MFRNFLKAAICNLSKNKFFTILNVIGLGLGMSLKSGNILNFQLVYLCILFLENAFTHPTVPKLKVHGFFILRFCLNVMQKIIMQNKGLIIFRVLAVSPFWICAIAVTRRVYI